MEMVDIERVVQLGATVVGVAGGLLGLYKFYESQREKDKKVRSDEIRSWQKIIVYNIFRKRELDTLAFDSILTSYREEAFAFKDFDIDKNEISPNALNRILLNLMFEKIVVTKPNNSFRLNIKISDEIDIYNINKYLLLMVGENPFTYTMDDVLRDISPKVGIAIPLLRTNLMLSISQGFFVLDENGKMAFQSKFQ